MNQMTNGDTRLPVTVLSGFLGSGKTTLLKHILEWEHGIRFALIVNDMNELNIDAKLVKKSSSWLKQTEERLVEMQNGCICCTLREDLLVEIKRLALMEPRKFDYLLIESTGVSEPMPIAETFTFGEIEPSPAHADVKEQEQEQGDTARDIDIEMKDGTEEGKALDTEGVMKTLQDIARLDTMVTVVDAQTFEEHLDSAKMLSERFPTERVQDEDDRTVADLLIDQVEFANVILLNKTDKAHRKTLKKIEQLIRCLNPDASVIRTRYCKVDPLKLINTKMFSMERAMTMPGWLQQIRGQEKPETLEYGISSWVYRRRRPFHPARLEKVLNTLGTLGVVRSKGFVWIATWNDFCVEWSGTSKMTNLEDGGNWYVVIPEEDWDVLDPEVVKRDFEGEHGDRRQELVLITTCVEKKEEVHRLLDAALLSDQEMMLGCEEWEKFDDPLGLEFGEDDDEEESEGEQNERDMA